MIHRCCESNCGFQSHNAMEVTIHELEHLDLSEQRCRDCSFVSASYNAWSVHLLKTEHEVLGDDEVMASLPTDEEIYQQALAAGDVSSVNFVCTNCTFSHYSRAEVQAHIDIIHNTNNNTINNNTINNNTINNTINNNVFA